MSILGNIGKVDFHNPAVMNLLEDMMQQVKSCLEDIGETDPRNHAVMKLIEVMMQ